MRGGRSYSPYRDFVPRSGRDNPAVDGRRHSIERFRRVVTTAYGYLDERRREVNDLNVFPVADGDTGDNMALTLQAVLEALQGLDGSQVDEGGRQAIVDAVAHAALMGARGNSGVILSQIVSGAAQVLAEREGQLVDPELVRVALLKAIDTARQAIPNPAPGTMLTVLEEMSNAIQEHIREMEKIRLEPEASDDEQDALLAELLEVAVDAGRTALDRTPEQLPVLAEHGVVDAGGYGLLLLVAGIIAGLLGEAVEVSASRAAGDRSVPSRGQPLQVVLELRRCRARNRSAALRSPARGARRLGDGRRRPGRRPGSPPHEQARARKGAFR